MGRRKPKPGQVVPVAAIRRGRADYDALIAKAREADGAVLVEIAPHPTNPSTRPVTRLQSALRVRGVTDVGAIARTMPDGVHLFFVRRDLGDR